MKPTWGIRKLNEYSISKDTAIIITDSEKDNYYWADIPDGSLLVNDKTGNLSIKLTGESDWVPVGIRKDGTDKLVKDAVINVEYYTIVKFELEHNRFYYHDREEITRIGKLIDGKAQFKVGSGLYIPGTNQLEVLINDTVRCNTLDDSLEEINMKYFQIDADDIRLGSTVTVRYINYERLSELYPFIFIQERYPWFFEDKDIWINTAENVSEDGLAITPMSYTVSYPADDPAHAEVTVFTTKKSRLIATHRRDEYFNDVTKRSITKFKVPRKVHDYYLNLFSTYFGYQTNYSKALIKGTQTETDKLTLDAEMLYPNALMSRASVKTQIGNIVTFKRDGKKLYASQNIGMGVQYNLPREEDPYDITVIVRNPSNGLSKEKVLTVDRRKIVLMADISHETTNAGTNITISTIPNADVKIEVLNDVTNQFEEIVLGHSNESGKYNFIVPIATAKKRYRVIISSDKADNEIKEEFDVLLHRGSPELSASHTRNKNDISLTIKTESGSRVLVKYNGNIVHSNIADINNTDIYMFDADYEKDRVFVIESTKENKIFETINYTIPKSEKYVPDILLSLKQTPANFLNETNTYRYKGSFLNIKTESGSLITVYNEDGTLYKDKFNPDGIKNLLSNNFSDGGLSLTNLPLNRRKYFLPQRRTDKVYKLKSIKHGKIDEEITFTVLGSGLNEYEATSDDNSYVLNPYIDLYENSDSYRTFRIKIIKRDEFSEPSIYSPSKVQIKNKPDTLITYNNIDGKDYFKDSMLYGGPISYSVYFDKINNTYKANQKLLNHFMNLRSDNSFGFFIPVKINNIDELIKTQTYTFVVDNDQEYTFTYSPVMLHYKNLDDLLIRVSSDRMNNSEYKDVINSISRKGYDSSVYLSGADYVTKYALNSNVKVIHPSLIRHISISTDRGYNLETEKNSLVSKLKEKEYIKNDEQEVVVDNFNLFGNQKLIRTKEERNHVYVLQLSNSIELLPLNFQYEYATALLKNNKKYESHVNTDDYCPNFIFDLRNISEESKQISVPIKIKRNKVFFDTLKELGYSSNDYHKSNEINQINLGCRNLLILSNRETVPSNYYNAVDNINISGIYYMPNVTSVKDNALSMLSRTFVYLNYPKLKQLGNDCFYNLYFNDGYVGSLYAECTNLDNDNTIIIDNMNYQILARRSPFPSNGNSAGKFKLKITADNWYPNIISIDDVDKKIVNKFVFVLSGLEEIIYDKNDLTFTYPILNGKITTQNWAVSYSYPHIDSTKVKSNNIYKNSAKFFKCSYLKKINLDYFKNYFSDYVDFQECQNIETIIMPKNYLVKGTLSRTFEYCSVSTIENFDNLLVCNESLNSTFRGCTELKSDLNMNYLKVTDSSAFEKCGKLSNFVYRKVNVNVDCEGNIVNLDGCLEASERGEEIIQNNYSYYSDTSITQESFDRIKKHMKKMIRSQFAKCKNIKELVIDQNCPLVYFMNAFNTPLKKIVFDNNTIDWLEVNDEMFKDNDLISNAQAYKINSNSLRIFNAGQNSLGLYSSIHSLNMPNLKYSFVASPNKLLGVYHVDQLERSLFTKHIPDTAGINSGVTYSVFNKSNSENVIQNEELQLMSTAFTSHFFDESINKNDIKIKKLIYMSKDYSISEYDGIIWTDSVFLSDHHLKKWVETMRWPALEEVEVKTNIFYPEKTVLGVKIKYVQA